MSAVLEANIARSVTAAQEAEVAEWVPNREVTVPRKKARTR